MPIRVQVDGHSSPRQRIMIYGAGYILSVVPASQLLLFRSLQVEGELAVLRTDSQRHWLLTMRM